MSAIMKIRSVVWIGMVAKKPFHIKRFASSRPLDISSPLSLDIKARLKAANLIAPDLNAPSLKLSNFHFGKTVDRSDAFLTLFNRWKERITTKGENDRRAIDVFSVFAGSPGTFQS